MPEKNHQQISLSPLKITVIYLMVAALWIAFTDRLLESLVTDTHALSILQTYKGWFYVLLTGTGLYWLIKKHDQQLQKKEVRLKNLLDEIQSEKELKDVLFERIPILITIYDPNLEEFEVNREFEKVTGWTNKEIEQENIDLPKACYPDKETRKEVVEFMNTPDVGWKEIPTTTKSGEEIPVSWTNVRLTDNTSVGIGIDMTEIKASQAKIRESRKLLKKIFESLESSLIVVDTQNRTIVDCNSATEKIFGYSQDELIGSSTRILHINEESFKKFDEMGDEALENDGVFQTEFRMKKKDGTIFHSDHTVSLVYNEEGELDKAVSVIRDITDRKEYENKLKRRQERLLQSQKIGKIGDWEFDLETKEISWSPMMYTIFERNTSLGTPSFEDLQTDYYGASSKEHNKAIEKAIEDKESFDIDLQLTTEKGNQKYLRAIGIPIENKSGEVEKLQGIIQDITQRKQSEKELEQRNQFIETTLENLPIGVAVNRIDEGTATLMNKKFTQIYGWPREELKNVDTFFEKVYPDVEYRNEIIEQVQKDIASGNPERMQWDGISITTQDGEERIVNTKNIPLYDQNLMISTVEDVTQEYKLKQEITLQNQKLERAQRVAGIGYWEYDLKHEGPPVWSDNLKRIYGLSTDFQPTIDSFLEMVPLEDQPDFDTFLQKVIKEEIVFDMFRVIKPSGQEGVYHSRNELITDADGNPSKVLGIVHEITDLKETEKELAKEKQRFQLVAETTSDVIWDLDFEKKELWWSKGFEETFGYERKGLRENYKAWEQYIHPDDRDKVSASSKKALNSDAQRWTEEYRLIKADDSIAYLVDRAVIIRNDEGEAIRMVGTMDDITERKKAEMQLQKSEEKYRHLFENNPEPMWIYDPNTLEFVEVNQAAINHYGYSEKEFLNMTLLDVHPPEDAEALKQNVEQNVGSPSYSEEWVHLKKDSTAIDVELSAADVNYKEGKTYRLVLINDITEKKRLQEKIIQSVIEGEDRERKRIAHELHDGLGQHLVAASMNLQSVKSDIEVLSAKRQNQFKTGLSLLKNALSETRSIAHNLMPKAISDYGLIAALENLIKNFDKSTDIEFHFQHNCDELELNNKVEINIYRIFQEIMTNAVRHAQCSTIDIELQVKKDTLKLIIKDDGIGAQLDEQQEHDGLGLRSIKTRVSNLKGTMDINSEPGKGMKTQITIPNIETLTTNGSNNG